MSISRASFVKVFSDKKVRQRKKNSKLRKKLSKEVNESAREEL